MKPHTIRFAVALAMLVPAFATAQETSRAIAGGARFGPGLGR